MTSKADDRLLAVIDALYEAALTPEEYERFANAWDDYLSTLDPDEPGAARIVAHADKALSIIERLHGAPSQHLDPEALVESEAAAAAVVSADGAIVAANDAWSAQGLGGALWSLTDDHDERRALRDAVRRLHDVARDRTSLVRLADPGSGGGRLVAVRRLFAPADDHDGAPLYLVRLAQSVWSHQVADYLAAEFNLTSAELALLQRMTNGHSFAEIAESTGRAVETLKSQSKSIYSKMHAAGREEAVRTALYLHLFMDAIADAHPLQDGAEIAVLADGRRIAWTRRGAKDGRKFLFLHGMSLGHGMTAEFESLLVQNNLSAICIDRPGYGRSDPPHNWRNCVDEWVDLYPDLIARLGLDHAPIVTHTSGVMHACAAAARYPDLVPGVCALAGGVPILDDETLSAYPPQVRVISRTAKFSPVALRFVAASGAAFYFRALGTRRLIKRTYANSQADTDALKNPEIYDLVKSGMEMISHGGLDGFVGDACSVFGDWSALVGAMKTPLLYVVGEDDPICPLGWARAFAQRYRHVEVTSIAGAGQLLHHTHPKETAGEVAAFIDSLA